MPLLEKLTEIPVQIQYKLQANISLNLYDSYRNAITDGKKFNPQTLRPHTQCPIYVTSLAELPKGLPISCGTYFSGHITYAKDENRKKVEQFVFKYVIDSEQQKKAKDSKDQKNGEVVGDKTPEQQFNEAINELKISWIPK